MTLRLIVLLLTLPFSAAAQMQPSMRGMNTPNLPASDLQELAIDWRANLCRYQMYNVNANSSTLEQYLGWLSSELDALDTKIAALQGTKLKIVIDMHTSPGGLVPQDPSNPGSNPINKVFVDSGMAEGLVQVWKIIATRYAGSETVIGYDILNEPRVTLSTAGNITQAGRQAWHDLATTIIGAIRQIDPTTSIVYEPAYGAPSEFDKIGLVPGTGVVYSFHLYEPLHFTHQKVPDSPFGTGRAWPTTVNGVRWTRRELGVATSPVVSFQRSHKVPFFVGEFSAIRWAGRDTEPSQDRPHAFNYLKDCIELFESNDWSWAYHAFREYHGWSVEHDSDITNVAPVDSTPREQLLRAWFARNAP